MKELIIFGVCALCYLWAYFAGQTAPLAMFLGGMLYGEWITRNVDMYDFKETEDLLFEWETWVSEMRTERLKRERQKIMSIQMGFL